MGHSQGRQCQGLRESGQEGRGDRAAQDQAGADGPTQQELQRCGGQGLSGAGGRDEEAVARGQAPDSGAACQGGAGCQSEAEEGR